MTRIGRPALFDEPAPVGFEPFALEFRGRDGNDYRIGALRLKDSEWCVNPWIRADTCGVAADLFVVSHVTGLTVSTYPVRKQTAIEAVCACAATCATPSKRANDEMDDLIRALTRVVAEAEDRDLMAYWARSGEAHA